jgi:hemerythrin
MIEWTPKLAVGVAEIDRQHQELFRRADQLLEGIRAGKEVSPHLDFLHEYAVKHFGAEEEWMRESRYPGYVRHQAEHDRFVEDLVALSDAYERDGAEAFREFHTDRWLATWLEDHLCVTDAELGQWLSGRAA